MKYDLNDYNILSYLLNENTISYDQTITWAYAQFTDDGVDPFIEKISLCLDKAEIRQVISNDLQVYGEPCNDFLLGETAHLYKTNKIDLCTALRKILYTFELQLEKAMQEQLYTAEDYYDWHKDPDKKAKLIVEPIFEKFLPFYQNELSKFSIK